LTNPGSTPTSSGRWRRRARRAKTAFTVTDDKLQPFAALNPDDAATRLLHRLLPLPASDAYRRAIGAASPATASRPGRWPAFATPS
jgi:hypothetical protein